MKTDLSLEKLQDMLGPQSPVDSDDGVVGSIIEILNYLRNLEQMMASYERRGVHDHVLVQSGALSQSSVRDDHYLS